MPPAFSSPRAPLQSGTATPQNTTVDDTDLSVQYLTVGGAVDRGVCLGCSPKVPGLVEFNFGRASASLYVILEAQAPPTVTYQFQIYSSPPLPNVDGLIGVVKDAT
ncbi:hypothetical protein C8J57DRAFT_1499674 [Mycena rebaudengoi]|nr:hypothetical protein C8J57DRAFT_1499674 [Mycena rebaudengoi]